MRTNEFIKILRDRRYDVEAGNNNDIYIRNVGGAVLAYVSGRYRSVFAIEENAAVMLNNEERLWLVDFISEYSKTPTEDRELSFEKVKAKDFLKAGELYRSFLIMLATTKGFQDHYTKRCLVEMLKYQQNRIRKLEVDLKRQKRMTVEINNENK